MSSVAQASPTVAFIRQTVRELTASSGSNQLTTTYIDQTLNDIYNTDFPYAIKLDQMRSVYTFFTQPYIDRYPLDVNYNQGVRSPFYVDKIQGYFYKDREEFHRVWPDFPTLFTNIISGDGITSTFNFTVPGPFLRNQVVLGGTATGGNAILVADDGLGKLQLQVPNPVISVPVQINSAGLIPPPPIPAPIPGMLNTNTANPGLITVTNIGTVNYVTGAFSVTFPNGYIPAIPTQNYPAMNLWVSQYTTGRPFSLLFWNNTFTIRPIPKLVHKITVETYLTPVAFLNSTDQPILNQWCKLLAYYVAAEILRRRQDIAGLTNIMEGVKRQEGLVLERQANEEINQRNATIFSSSVPSQEGNYGFNQGFIL